VDGTASDFSAEFKRLPERNLSQGAYVLQMLRSIMYSAQDQDKAFIAMMHEFVESHRDRAASSESFKAIVEKHMSKDHGSCGEWAARLVL